MLFSKRSEYAIRALVHLARARPVCAAREISRGQHVPYHFIGKILQELKAKGLVKSVRGAGGGFALARPAGEIRLIEVLEAVEQDHFLNRCIYGFASCADSDPCPLHEGWKPIKHSLEVYLNHHSIADIEQALADRLESSAVSS